MERGVGGEEWKTSAIGRAGAGRVGRRASEMGGGGKIEELGSEKVEWV